MLTGLLLTPSLLLAAENNGDWSIKTWTFIIVGCTFALYIAIAFITRVSSTSGFYVAGKGVPAIANGMATAADWMSAASFISMAGLISFKGYDGAYYLMGWTGGYVLLALLLAPYLRKYGKYTVPEFVGERYYSGAARLVAVFCAIFVSFTYVAGQMRGVGLVFSRFLEVPVNQGVVIGMVLVFFYAAMGGMKGITYTQVAQYCVLIVAYLIPAVVIGYNLTNNPVPQIAFGSEVKGHAVPLLQLLNDLHREFGFREYTANKTNYVDIFAITIALMVGTAGLPHVIIRFYTVRTVRAARWSAFWALLFIGILYTTAPAVAAFARVNLLQALKAETQQDDSAQRPQGENAHIQENEKERPSVAYADVPDWFKKWEDTGLLIWVDKNHDGKIQYRDRKAFKLKPNVQRDENGDPIRGKHGEVLVENEPTDSENELYVDPDIMVLAFPEIADLPHWVVALVAAGGLAAALSTAAGLLLVISSAVSHDLCKKSFYPDMSERKELLVARVAAGVAVIIAGLFGIYPPGFVAEVVAFAFGLAASSFFPIIVLGIFWKRTSKEGAIAGMLTGILFTASYIIFFKFIQPDLNNVEYWLFGISPEGIGTVGMMINFIVTFVVTKCTPEPPESVQAAVENLRYPDHPAHAIEPSEIGEYEAEEPAGEPPSDDSSDSDREGGSSS